MRPRVRKSRQKPDVWSLAEKISVPFQLQECLKVCGYESVSAIARIADVTVLEKWLRDNHFLFATERREALYGVYSSTPGKFEFLPGQKEQLDVFRDVCKKAHREFTENRTTTTTVSARPRLGGTRRMRNEPPTKANEDQSAVSANNCSMELGTRLELQVHDDIKCKLHKWCAKQQDLYVKSLKSGKDFTILVRHKMSASAGGDGAAVKRKGTDTCDVSASVLCFTCGKDIKLHYRRTSFTIANVTRHLAKCVTPQKLSEQRSQEEMMSMLLELQENGGSPVVKPTDGDMGSDTEEVYIYNIGTGSVELCQNVSPDHNYVLIPVVGAYELCSTNEGGGDEPSRQEATSDDDNDVPPICLCVCGTDSTLSCDH